jgi:hypothetical protein
MIDRLIVSIVLGTIGWNGLFSEPPVPLTLKQQAKEKSMSAVCDKKKKSNTVKEMCKRWERHERI